MAAEPLSRFGFIRRTQTGLSFLLLLAVAACGTSERIPAHSQREMRPSEFLARLSEQHDSLARARTINRFVQEARERGRPYAQDSLVFLWYRGPADLVAVPSDLNRWDPRADTMQRVEKTDFFHITKHCDPSGRFEYKLVTDSTWILDPANPGTIQGGFGPNSEIRMPEYVPPPEIVYQPNIPRGTIDTLELQSQVLERSQMVYVYLPHDYEAGVPHPTLHVADGPDYLSRAETKNILDNLIAERLIPGLVVVFLDPRTDPLRPETNMRMVDYGISEEFNTYLTEELRDTLMSLYALDPWPQNTAVMGASLGGLAATYAAWKHPDVFGLCAAQSPAYQWKNDTLLTMIATSPRKEIVFHISTGTIHDAKERSRRMNAILSQKGYQLRYTEHPEGHNWGNWRARISDILTFFWGAQ